MEPFHRDQLLRTPPGNAFGILLIRIVLVLNVRVRVRIEDRALDRREDPVLFGVGRLGLVALVTEGTPEGVPVAEELSHVVADIEVFDVSGKTFPRGSAVIESELDVFQRAMVHPVEDEVEGGRVWEGEVDDGVGVGGGKEMGGSSGEGGLRGRGRSRPAEEASEETRLRAEIIDVGLIITMRFTTTGKEQRERPTVKDLREMDTRFPWVVDWGLETSWMTEWR